MHRLQDRRSWTSRAPRPFPAVLLALFVLALLLPTASAHADLSSAQPAPNSQVEASPSELVLRFSEELSDTYTNVEVLRNGTDHARTVTIDEDDRRRLTVELTELPDGVYSVRWRTLSAADGHTRSGVYFLAVNASLGGQEGPSPADPDNGSGQAPPGGDTGLLEPPFRALGFAGASLAVGLPLFLLLTGGLRLPARFGLRLDALTLAGAGTASLSALGLLAGLAHRIDAGLAAAAGTEPGQVLVLRAALFGAAAPLFLAAALRRWPTLRSTLAGTGVLLSLAGLLATSLGGHAAASEHLALAVVNDWAHQVAVAFWVAGVVALVLAAVEETTERDGAALVRRFSPLAAAAVAIIVVTGTLATLDRLPRLEQLWTTGYGLALLAKIALLLPLLALGAYHRYWVLPDLDVPGQRVRDFSRLRVSAGVEVALMAVVLVAAGLLTSFSPPLAADDGGAGPQGQAFQPYHQFNESGLHVELFLKPQPVTVGFQELFVNVTSADGSPLNRSQLSGFLTLEPPSSRGGESTPREGHFFHNETFHFGGALFTEPGNWTATLVLQGGQGEDYRYVQHRFPVRVRAAD